MGRGRGSDGAVPAQEEQHAKGVLAWSWVGWACACRACVPCCAAAALLWARAMEANGTGVPDERRRALHAEVAAFVKKVTAWQEAEHKVPPNTRSKKGLCEAWPAVKELGEWMAPCVGRGDRPSVCVQYRWCRARRFPRTRGTWKCC